MNKDELVKKLDIIIPNPKCELNYSKDYELLIAVMLSAQCTDKRVNAVTKDLFKKYATLKSIAEAKIRVVEKVDTLVDEKDPTHETVTTTYKVEWDPGNVSIVRGKE